MIFPKTKRRTTENRESTLRLRKPSGKTVGLTLIVLIGLVVLVETAVRIPFIRSILPRPCIGSCIEHVDLKIPYLLDQYESKNGPVDCFFVGHSFTYRGMDPDVFSQSFKARTGKNIICFNMGVHGLHLSAAEILIEVLEKRYKPKLLILSSLPSFKRQGEPVEERLRSNPWIQHCLGSSNVNGWLSEHSRAYGLFIRFFLWLSNPRYSIRLAVEGSRMPFNGYCPRKTGKRSMRKVTSPPDPIREARKFRRFVNVKISTKHLDALEQILQNRSDMEILIVEMPVHHSFLDYFGESSEGFEHYIAETKKCADRHHVLFWPTTLLNLIPDDGWINRNHLNYTGAQIFSRWLGEKVGDAVNEGLLANPVQAQDNKTGTTE